MHKFISTLTKHIRMPHCYYNQCFLDKMKAEAEKAENAATECERLAAIRSSDAHAVRQLTAAANTATAAAVNTVCISKVYETDVLDAVGRIQRDVCALRATAQSAGINTTKYDYVAFDLEASKEAAIACVNSAIASAKKAEAVTLECIRDSGMQSKVKCDTVLVEPMHQNVETHWKWLASFAICGVAILMQQLFTSIVCDISI